jgi:hypothetical protein
MTSARRIAIVGAGPAGTALATGLLHAGQQVTLVSDRTPQEIRSGSVMSSQVTFESALEAETALGLTDLLPASPPITRMSYATKRPNGSAAELTADLATPARSLDQRVRLPLLIDEIERRGAKVIFGLATVEDLEELAAEHDLVVVCTGRGGLASLFAVDEARSPYSHPQRVAALTYLHDVLPDPAGPTLRYHCVEGVGECFTCPALTVDGPCDVFVVEGVPGGPLDAWDDVRTTCSPGTSRRRRRAPGRHGLSMTGRCCAVGSCPPYAGLRGCCPPARPCSGWPTWWCSTTR